MEIKVKKHGPAFDGRAAKAVDDFRLAAKEEVADQAVNEVQATLGHVLKNPTGYYSSRITTNRQQNDFAVTDNGVVYGPWLEGVGSRNQTTRFKGYATFRKVAQKIQRQAGDIAERVLPQYLRRMQ